MEPLQGPSRITPKIVIHGGAGNVTRSNFPPSSRRAYLSVIAEILREIHPRLLSGELNALDVATEAVALLENNPLFNAGKGAVFNLDGKNELEASVMVSRGHSKRGVGVFLLKTVKNPIQLARELLVRPVHGDGEKVAGGGSVHNGLSGEYAEKLAEEWGLDIVDPGYFWTETRWKQHLRGLTKEASTAQSVDTDSSFPPRYQNREDEDEYLPKGTVGCVVLDSTGTIAVATSTGGLTNKLPGRIGDTPTLGCGFWAEEFPTSDSHPYFIKRLFLPSKRALGVSGTGNGDFFLRLAACHDIAARCRFGGASLREATKAVVGKGGEMEKAGIEGEGGVIGIDNRGEVVMDMNCGGMFRGTVDDAGRVLVAAFADEELEIWPGA